MNKLTDLNVIVIEDNEDGGEILQALIEHLGMRVTITPQPQVGIAHALAEIPAVILCDLHLPGTDGYKVLSDLRQHPELANTRIIAMSAIEPMFVMARCKAAGFDGFIAKPMGWQSFPGQMYRVVEGIPVWDAH
ncbi:MAG: response regulator [Phototrophicaceae bacterium]|jgi:CheY-like chemotaxis protein